MYEAATQKQGFLECNLPLIRSYSVGLGQTKVVVGGFWPFQLQWWCPFSPKMIPITTVSKASLKCVCELRLQFVALLVFVAQCL